MVTCHWKDLKERTWMELLEFYDFIPKIANRSEYLIHLGFVYITMRQNIFSIGSDNGLLPDDTNSLF